MTATVPRGVKFPVSKAESRMGSVSAAITALVALSLIASWLSALLPIENSVTVTDAEGKFVLIEVKTPLYYIAHSIEIGAAIGAGVLAALTGRFAKVSPGARVALAVLFITATAWAIQAYGADEILSSNIFGVTGPFVWFALVLIFAGADRRIWSYVDPVIRALAYASSILAVRALLTSDYGYYNGFSKYILYAILLMWLGGWTLLTATRLRGWRLVVRVIPFLALILMAVCSQSRSWLIMSFLLGVIFIWLRSRETGSALSGMRTVVVIGVLGAAAVAALYTTMPKALDDSVSGMVNRMNDDTRSGQYRAFFAVVPVGDLLLGRGPKGTWYWRGRGEYQFFDNGYLWMLFIGGVPTLVCYFLVVVWPAIRAMTYRPRGVDAAATFLVLLFGLALTGLSTFTIPSISLSSFLTLLWAGRCHLFLSEHARPEYMRAQRLGYQVPRLWGRVYQSQEVS